MGGWNTWCTDETCGYDVCNSDEIKEIAQAMLTNGMYDVGYRFIDLDDCWSACNRTEDGLLYAEPTRFPDGMATMIREIHEMNSALRFGLYTDVGTHTCSGGNRNGCSPPGLYGHYTQDANTLAEWKVDLIKFDNCRKPDNETWEDLHTEFSVALNKTGRAILLELDGGYELNPPPTYMPKISQAWKVVSDHHDDWDSTKKTLESIRGSNNSAMTGEYAWAYGDFLMTGGQGCKGEYNNEEHLHCPGQSDVEYMTAFSIFAISGSPLLVATDIRNMTDIMKKVLLNTEIIAINQQLTPGGNVAYIHKCDGPDNICQVWTRKLKEANSIAVVALNIDDTGHSIPIQFDKLGMGWTNTTKVSVRDLWEHSDVGTFTNYYDVGLEAHSTFFAKLTVE